MTAVDLIAIDEELLDEAARIEPAELRTLDAIHLASALVLEDALGALIAYDARLLEAARAVGVRTLSPT